MKKIGIISDTHGFWDKAFKRYFSECDEIWHAGDIGHLNIIDQLKEIAPLKAVFGNIDNNIIRQEYQEDEVFEYKNQKIFITHIAGKLGSYYKNCREKIALHKPDILICGHSHILKVMYDQKNNLLHMNPGAIGDYGIHKVKTILSFNIEGKEIKNLKVIEFPRNKS